MNLHTCILYAEVIEEYADAQESQQIDQMCMLAVQNERVWLDALNAMINDYLARSPQQALIRRRVVWRHNFRRILRPAVNEVMAENMA